MISEFRAEKECQIVQRKENGQQLTVSEMFRSVCFIAHTIESMTNFWCSGGMLNKAWKQCESTA